MANFYSIITNRGKELEAEALASGTKITLAKFVVGDGNGQATPPKPTQTKLVNEKYRGNIGELSISPEQSTQMMAKIVLPTDVGGFTVREIGILTDAGELYAVANCAAIEKPVGGVSVNMQFRLAVSDTANITLNVATGDGLFLRIDQDLSEIRGRGAQAQKTARESLAIVDASTKQKGLVQLNSATNSTSDTQAATPAAVKAVKDSAVQKDGNLSDIADKSKTRENLGLVKQTSQTDSTPGAVMMVPAFGLGGTAPRTPVAASYSYDSIPANLPTGFYTHQMTGGPFCHTITLLQDGGGATSDRHFIIPSNQTDKVAIRWDSGKTFSYQYFYTDKNKPTATDVGALPSNGNAVSATKLVTARKIAGKVFDGTADITITAANVGALPIDGGTVTGQLKVTNEIQSTYADGFRIAYGSYGSYWRNDGANLYLMLTDKDKPFGGYNALRPFMVNLASGEVTLGRAKFSDYTYLDARYQAKGNYTPAGEAYTKAVSDGRFQPKGNYTPAGEAYTKAVSDGRFQPKGSYTPAGQAYTKGESDGRYVQNMRLGTAATINIGGNGSVPGGCVVVGAGTDDWKLNRLIYKPIQRNINGVWATISG